MSTQRIFRVAIDGPAGAGKSSTAKLQVASLLSFTYIDSGAFYRCVALNSLRWHPELFEDGNARHVSLEAPDTRRIIAKVAESTVVKQETERALPGSSAAKGTAPLMPRHRIWLGDDDVSVAIRDNAISRIGSDVAKLIEVREAVGKMQRAAATNVGSRSSGGIVMDGRDIGTHVFPDAELKVFITCPAEVRARRRLLELQKLSGGTGNTESRTTTKLPTYDQVLEGIKQRDVQDTTRAVSPLRKAEDALEVDTSDRTLSQIAHHIADIARQRMNRLN
ncbi:Cytidylate kinase [Gonapodya prolifera JEL478]|uniref:(d)CMP kinase n=1 Tax=Gonapodya prolifera (strain JEL478) TaxID=1344416 RepID=A0A139A3Q3_GONPJ|nr:Cytidylate kinase [Gonapodya prolifera JEL478]|eukprot:KXS11447.1 Cytidylate kinase [Gonapodya prolifera JEL478]